MAVYSSISCLRLHTVMDVPCMCHVISFLTDIVYNNNIHANNEKYLNIFITTYIPIYSGLLFTHILQNTFCYLAINPHEKELDVVKKMKSLHLTSLDLCPKEKDYHRNRTLLVGKEAFGHKSRTYV